MTDIVEDTRRREIREGKKPDHSVTNDHSANGEHMNGHKTNHNDSLVLKRVSWRRAEVLAALGEDDVGGFKLAIDAQDPEVVDKGELLRATANSGAVECTKYLLSTPEVEVNAVNEDGETALMRACLAGHTGVARELVEKGAKVNMVDKDGYSSLHNASSRGHADLVEYLLSSKALPDTQSHKFKSTPLIAAASRGYRDVCRLLIEAGARLDYRNIIGDTAFDCAAEGSWLEICNLISDVAKQKGIDPAHHVVIDFIVESQRLGPPKAFSSRFLLAEGDMPFFADPATGKAKWREEVELPTESVELLLPLALDNSGPNPAGSNVSDDSEPEGESNAPRKDHNTPRLQVVPAKWVWITDWCVDMSHGLVDSEGWQYARGWSGPWLPKADRECEVRQRRWCRVRKIAPLMWLDPTNQQNHQHLAIREAREDAVPPVRKQSASPQKTPSKEHVSSMHSRKESIEHLAARNAVDDDDSYLDHSAHSVASSLAEEEFREPSSVLQVANAAPPPSLGPRSRSRSPGTASTVSGQSAGTQNLPDAARGRTMTPLEMRLNERGLLPMVSETGGPRRHIVRRTTEFRARWLKDNVVADCGRCGVRFTIFKRRHHCRSCGGIYCDSCSSHTFPLPEYDNQRLRVCEACYEILKREYDVAEKSGAHRKPAIEQIDDDEGSDQDEASRKRHFMVAEDSEHWTIDDCPVCYRRFRVRDPREMEKHVTECISSAMETGTGRPGEAAYVVTVAEKNVEDIECIICFEEYYEGQEVATLPCLCKFHRGCIEDWLQRGAGCPTHNREQARKIPGNTAH
eukprot:Clim_evm210s157 gene=Clim_evmTU210s157